MPVPSSCTASKTGARDTFLATATTLRRCATQQTFSNTESTAVCVYAVISTLFPRATRQRVMKAIVAVLPVPGIPNKHT
jgi:hypothetical protein